MDRRSRLFVLLFFLILISFSHAQVITTVAGNGASTYAGDGGAAISASMSEPEGVVVDGAGNIFIADEDNNVIRKVNAVGIISTIAGTGISGYSGNGGQATAAKLSLPANIALNKLGDLYIADTYNHAIRKVDHLTGIITTVAGIGVSGFSGDNGAAIVANLNLPEGIAVDAIGILYISDSGNNRVRKVDTSGIITTLAGTGVAGYGGDNGAASAAILNYPSGIVFDTTTHKLYVADESNSRIRVIDTFGIIKTFAGTGVAGNSGDGGLATAAQLNTAEGMAIDTAGNVYISDSGNSRVRKVNTSGIINNYVATGVPGFSGDNGPALCAQLFNQKGIAVDVTGNLFIAEYFNSRVRKVSFCAAPIAITITGADTICLGDSLTLHANGANTYIWSANANSSSADSVVVKPTITSAYVVCAVSGPCSAIDSVVVVVKTCSSGLSTNGEGEFLIYPNPAGDILQFKIGDEKVVEGISIYNLQGEKIIECAENLSSINISNLDKGAYFAELKCRDGIARKIFFRQ